MVRTLALIDGEHHPPVVRAAIAALADEVQVALLLPGAEKLRRSPAADDYGVGQLEIAGPRPADDVARLLAAHALDAVVDLSDEPVLDGPRRFALAGAALAGGATYVAGGMRLEPPCFAAYELPSLAIVGTGKRIGKTAVAGYLARIADARLGTGATVVVAMGRGGPAEPELIDPHASPLGLAELVARSRSGAHAASDFLEDAVLKGVVTVGCRRCGGGPFGDVSDSTVLAGARLAASRRPALTIFEGSGAAFPPIACDRTVLVTGAATPIGELAGYGGPYRLRRSHLVVLLASGAAAAERRAAIADAVPDLPVIEAGLVPRPTVAVAGRRLGVFTTVGGAGLAAIADALETAGAEVLVRSGALARRPELTADVERALAAGADLLLTEVKAAGIDVVAEAGTASGVEVGLLDHVPRASDGSDALDRALAAVVDACAPARS